jgi:hypothetical protein
VTSPVNVNHPLQSLTKEPSIREAGSVTKRLITAALLHSGATFCAVAQDTPDSFSIRVESNQVLIPTYVFYKDRMGKLSPTEIQCGNTNGATYYKLLPNQPYIPLDCDESLMRGLTAKDFRVSDDGVEQSIQKVTFESDSVVYVRDNWGDHTESSETPRGKWSTAETPKRFGPGYGTRLYRIAYVPSKLQAGSCHRVAVKVARKDAFVYARSQYCNVGNSPDDPLNGTTFGKKADGDATSEKEAKLDLWLQAGFFWMDANTVRADLTLEFPWDSLRRTWSEGSLYATIGVLGLVYKKDGTLAKRFSDFGCCASDEPSFVSTNGTHQVAYPDMDITLIPTRYETQIDLPPGEYNLKLILSDGSNFARAEVPLNIESYDGKQLGVSSLVLCKRTRDAAVAAQEAAAVNLAPQYVPLVSEGVQFTPTGDATFRKGDPLFAYYEVYEPLLASGPATTVQTELKITDVKTGQLKVDTGSRSAADWTEPGKSAIHIAEQIAVDKLPKGSYRLEVQATDSTGKSTVWRAANFTVE